MVRTGLRSVVAFVVMLVAGVASAEVLLPGLEVRAWQNIPYPNPRLSIDGAMFDVVAPSPAPNASTADGTIGYMILPIHVNEGLGEWFTRGGGFSGRTGYVDDFAVEYRGKLLVPASGNYRFSTTSDDGSALWIDPQVSNPSYAEAAVANNNLQVMTLQASGVIALDAGVHDLIVRYNQGPGGSGLYVQWDPSGGTNFTDIPGDRFFHEAVPEPSTIALLTSGFLGLVVLAWKRKRAS